MTSRRFSRRTRNPIRRQFTNQVATGTAIGAAMIDLTPVPELSSTADSQVGEILVTGMAIMDLADEAAIYTAILWIGRTSTTPAVTDRGVRTRQFGGNSQGIPFVLRFTGLRVDPGQLLKLITQATIETDAAIVHQHVVNVKWAFRELAQG